MRKVLHVGCAMATIAKMPKGFHEGWEEVRFDIDPSVRPDIVGTITDMAAVPSESVDAVFSSHNIEHVFAHEVPMVLREFLRVLKPTGFAVITCPDITSFAEQIARGLLTEPLYESASGPISPLDILYGHGAAIQSGEVYMAHKTAFTGPLLGRNMKEAGFPNVIGRRRPSRFDIWAVGTKARSDQQTLDELLAEYCGK